MMTDISFPQTISFIFLSLLVLWGGLLFGGFIAGTPNDNRTRRMPAWTRLTSSFVLVILAWFIWLNTHITDFSGLTLAFAIGMTCGWIGDLFMAQVIPLDDYVLGGMSAFGIGHIAYIIGLLSAGQTFNLINTPLQIGSLLIWLIVAVILWYRIVYHNSEKTILHKVALPYALLLASTSGIALGLALQHPLFLPITIGAGLFLLSDLILATELFNHASWRSIGDVVWLTYGPGQMLIVSGVVLYFVV